MIIDELLKEKPYSLTERSKFVSAVREAMTYQYKNSAYFRKFLDAQNFNPDGNYTMENVPFLPVAIFKELELITGRSSDIKKRVFSSSTTNNKPSMICLDQTTIDRQRIALSRIVGDFAGDKRMVFIIFDSPETTRAVKGELGSRGSAIRGMLLLANRYFFVLNNDMSLNLKEFQKAFTSIKNEERVCFFGFTWMIYRLLVNLKQQEISELNSLLKNTTTNGMLLHIGGWKKMTDLNVAKSDFNKLITNRLFLQNNKVIDIYGLTEQLGTVYPDCSSGFKHVPLYSEVIVRDSQNFLPTLIGKMGLLQFMTPIPNSYPGVSVLSDDIGTIIGLDGCSCGRRGKFFVFNKREETADLRGCGDTAYMF